MRNYADYAFYLGKYSGELDERAVNSVIAEASQYIRNVTLKKSDGYGGEEVKYAACAVCDVFGVSENSLLVSSENTDGYSVSYVGQGRSGETIEQLRNRKAYAAARIWLAGTGLLSRRAVRL